MPDGLLGVLVQRNLMQRKFRLYHCKDKTRFKFRAYYHKQLNITFCNCNLYAEYSGWPVLCSGLVGHKLPKLLEELSLIRLHEEGFGWPLPVVSNDDCLSHCFQETPRTPWNTADADITSISRQGLTNLYTSIYLSYYC